MKIEENIKRDDLRNKTVIGIAWTAVQKYSTMLIQFISGIILARLLTPYDYGCIGMLSIFMVLAESFIDGGFGAALIQKKQPTQEDYSTIFYWNISASVLLYFVLYFIAPFIAKFYNIPLLCKVLRIQGVVLIIYALTVIQSNILRRSMNFKLLSIVNITTSILSLIVTITLAYQGYGVWSLVAQNIIIAAIPCSIYWVAIKWRPLMVFSKKSFKELFSYGFYVFLSQLVNQFGQQVQGLLIGRLYNPSTMGYYSKAETTEGFASRSVSQVLTQVTFPLYSKIQDDLSALSQVIKRVTMSIAYITFPLLILLIILARPVILLLYSEKWLPCVPYFQVLCIAGIARSLLSANFQAITAIGKSKVHFRWTLIRRGVGIGLVVGGMLLYGMKGLLVGVVLNEMFSYLVNVFLVSKYVGYKWWNQFADLFPILVISIISALISFFMGEIIVLPLPYDSLMVFLVFILIYFSLTYLFRLEAFEYLKTTLKPFWEKYKK